MIKAYISTLLLFIFCACTTTKQKENREFSKIDLKYAKSFQLSENDSEFKIDFIDSDNQATVTSMVFPKKINQRANTAFFSSSAVGFLSEIQKINTVVAVEKLNMIYNQELVLKKEKGQLKEYLDYSLINPERLKRDGVNLVFYSLFSPEINPLDSKLAKLGITAIPLLEWKEEHPLGKAEWIKVYGIAFGCYDLAQQKFDEIEKSYQKTESLIQKITVSKPTILVGSMFQDIWYLPGGNSYMAKVIRDAQGDYVLKNDRTIGSQSFGFEQIYKKYAHSKKWINVGVGTKKELVSLYANYRYFDAFQTGQMYSYQKKFLKYFEESPVKPHLALLDLHKIFTEDNPTHLYFYSKLD